MQVLFREVRDPCTSSILKRTQEAMGWNTISPKRLRQRATALRAGCAEARNEARTSFIRNCCGPGEQGSPLDTGLGLFANSAEKRMLEYETYTTDLFNTLWGPQPGTSYLDRQLNVSTLIVGMLQSTTPQTTIDELVKQLFHHFNVSSRDAEPHQDAARHLVLASIGWSTMLYTASITAPGGGLSTVGNQPRSETGRRSLLSWWHRPLGTALRTRGQMPIACPPRAADARGIDTLLPVTHLNLFTLTRLGDISIVWMDDLSHHCDFDRYSRKKELKLFRLPSLCASICINQTDGSLLGR